jgi:hypothetical protein
MSLTNTLLRRTGIFFIMVWLSLLEYPDIHACTIFMGVSGSKVFTGNNEDFIDPNTYIWFLPVETNKYARVYFGYNTVLPQGGMNEKGLFFDCASVPAHIGKYFNKKEVYQGNLMELAMENCSDVEEIIALFDQYDRSYMTYQIFIADQKGNSVVIETDTMIVKKGNFQVATNFCQSRRTKDSYSLDRFEMADSMLNATNQYTVDYFARILDKIHQEGDSPTQYSNIFDLTNGDIFIYLFHNYNEVCKLNLFAELTKGKHSYRLSDLFVEKSAYNDFAGKYPNKDYTFIQADTSLFKDYTGVYAVDGFPPMQYYVTRKEGQLQMMMSGLDRYNLMPVSQNEFFMKEFELKATFIQVEGCICKMAVSIYGQININAYRIRSAEE